VLVEEVIPLSALNTASKRLFLKLEQGKGSLLPKIKQTLQRYPGNIPVVIFDEESNKKMLVPKEYYVNTTAAFLDLMDEMLGEGNVKTVNN
jgi:DNA polymerase-3 subunit alpha